MIYSFKKFLSENLGLSGKEKVLAAVSGGVDSIVLLSLLKAAGFTISVAHCNFKLRGIDADHDEKFVASLAERYSLPFFSTSFDTKRYSKEHNISTQMAARELRYNWLNDLLQQEGYDYIATAHHRNDVLETLLLNLTKGTGIAGLHGIRGKTKNLLRPLLFADKEEIISYAREQNLQWREDKSNASDKYQRNLIRNKVVPHLKKINPNLEETLETSVEKISAVEKVFHETVQQLKASCIEKRGDILYLDLKPVKKKSEPVIIIYHLLKEYGFNYNQTRDLYSSSEPGKKIFSASYIASKDRNRILITPAGKNFINLKLTEKEKAAEDNLIRIEAEFYSFSELKLSPAPSKAFLDKKKLKFPLTIRNWKEGDRFIPLGMKQKKKLSDFFIDQKVALAEKSRFPVVMSEGVIVWIAGLRIDERFKVTESTEEVVELTFTAKTQ